MSHGRIDGMRAPSSAPAVTRVMSHFKFIPLPLLALGMTLWMVGVCFPVYSEPGIAERLSHELQKLPDETRTKVWYEQMRSYETPHKRLTDLGRGTMALSIGLLLAYAVWHFYNRHTGLVRLGVFVLAWLSLWAIKIPFTAWFYFVRQARFDYPIWGDTTAIPVMGESIMWIVCAIVSLPVAFAFMFRHKFAPSLRPHQPSGWLQWARAIPLWLWLALTVWLVGESVWYGDEGMVISCAGAIPLLLVLLSARHVPKSQTEATHSLETVVHPIGGPNDC